MSKGRIRELEEWHRFLEVLSTCKGASRVKDSTKLVPSLNPRVSPIQEAQRQALLSDQCFS